MSLENQYFGGPGSGQTPDMLGVLQRIRLKPRCKECTFFIGHHVVEDYLKYCHLLAKGFCEIYHYILPGSQKTPESIRRVKSRGKVWQKYDKNCKFVVNTFKGQIRPFTPTILLQIS